MWENLRTVIISSITTILILGSLIWVGVIPLQPNTYQLRQTIQEAFTITGKNNQQTFTYPIKNITGEATERTLKVYVEFTETNNPSKKEINMEIQLYDTEINKEITKVTSNLDSIYGVSSIDFNLNPKRFYFVRLIIYGVNTTGSLRGNVLQDITRS